jgi:hypothetical protein
MCFDRLEATATIDNVFGVKDYQFNLSDQLTIEASHPIIIWSLQIFQQYLIARIQTCGTLPPHRGR